MPYKRRYRRRRRRPTKPMRYKVADTAYKAWKGVRYLKGLVNAEMHAFDNTNSVTINNSPGVVDHLSAIAVGDGNGDRSGLSILAKYLFGRLIFTKSPSATDTFIRMIIIKDNQQISDTPPTISQLLASTSVVSPLNKNTFNRFKILMDRTIRLDANKTSTNMKINLRLPYHTTYNGTSGTDIQKNGTYILFISNESVNLPSVQYDLRFSFYDN